MLKEYHLSYFLPPIYLANLLCELAAERQCHSPPPLPWPKDIRGLEDLDATHAWTLDDLERRRWNIYRKLLEAIAYGDLSTEDWGLPEEMSEQYGHVESRWSEDASNRAVSIHQMVPWALANNIPVPSDILEHVGIRDLESKKTNEGRYKAALEKRDSTFNAALVLIQENGIEEYLHKNSGDLNLSKLSKDIIKEQKKLFEEGTAPLGSAVFSRQFKTMKEKYRLEKAKSKN